MANFDSLHEHCEMEGSAGSFSGTAANVVNLAEEPWVLKFVFWRPFNLVPRAFSSTILKMVDRREKALGNAELTPLLIGPFIPTG